MYRNFLLIRSKTVDATIQANIVNEIEKNQEKSGDDWKILPISFKTG